MASENSAPKGLIVISPSLSDIEIIYNQNHMITYPENYKIIGVYWNFHMKNYVLLPITITMLISSILIIRNFMKANLYSNRNNYYILRNLGASNKYIKKMTFCEMITLVFFSFFIGKLVYWLYSIYLNSILLNENLLTNYQRNFYKHYHLFDIIILLLIIGSTFLLIIRL